MERGRNFERGRQPPLAAHSPFMRKWQKVGQGWIPNRVGNDVLLVGNDVLLVGNDVLLVGNDGGMVPPPGKLLRRTLKGHKSATIIE